MEHPSFNIEMDEFDISMDEILSQIELLGEVLPSEGEIIQGRIDTLLEETKVELKDFKSVHIPRCFSEPVSE